MCNWCDKETVGQPIVSGEFLSLICEHCGTKIEDILNWENIYDWVKRGIERKKKRNPAVEGYPKGWINANLMINPETKEIHCIGGDREPGEGDTAYIGFDLIKDWINNPRNKLSETRVWCHDPDGKGETCGNLGVEDSCTFKSKVCPIK